ncbi:MAG TPA: helix-turn-helix domain-containing protein [Terriglobales bacterium]|nr:helix-turn-helix domain-containing protein [Terriglobales bacterium]
MAGQPGSTRKRLIEAAAQLIAEEGYARVGILAIARRAGLTNGAIYGNFRDKAHLLAAAIEMKLQRTYDTLGLSRPVQGPPLDVIGRIARTMALDTPDADRRLLVEAWSAAWRDPDIAVLVRERLERIEAAVTGLGDQARARGDLAGDVDPATLARFGMALALGYDLIHTAGVREPDRDSWLRLTNRVLDCLRLEAANP